MAELKGTEIMWNEKDLFIYKSGYLLPLWRKGGERRNTRHGPQRQVGTKAQRKELTGKKIHDSILLSTPIQMALCCFNNST